MVCTIVNGQSASTSSAGETRRKQGSPHRHGSLADQFRSNSISKADPTPYGKVSPVLVFQTRTYAGPTLEACCSVHSVSSYDSLDPSIVSETSTDRDPPTEDLTPSQRVAFAYQQAMPKKKTYTVPCDCIKTVEKVTSVFRGYRLFFATGSRGSYELEFENKNGMDIVISFLQAFLPAERFVNLTTPSVDGAEDSVSHFSVLDVEKLTERLAERQTKETMSERIRKGVGQMLSSIEECK